MEICWRNTPSEEKTCGDLKDLRPFSLTPCLSKVAEEFIVADYIKPAVLKDLDTNQYGAVPKSSTPLALLDMLHDWWKGTDGNSATIRPVLCDYRKAFDLIDHGILIRKLCMLDVPNSIVNWIIDFLSNRSQRIELGGGYVSEWESVPSGFPPGNQIRALFFLLLLWLTTLLSKIHVYGYV